MSTNQGTLFPEMPAGSSLSEEELNKASAYKELGFSFRKIARILKRSPGAVQHALKKGKNYKINLSTRGRKKKNSWLTRKRIAALARNSTKSAPSIKEELNLDCSARTVLNDIKREKLKKNT